MTRAETLAAIKENRAFSSHTDGYHCEEVQTCQFCAIAWLLQEIEYLNARLSVATLEFSVKCEPLMEANRILAADRERLKDALHEIACGTTAWERDEMIDHAEAALVGVER